MSSDRYLFLQSKLNEESCEKYPCHSRIHPLHSFPRGFVKRDDELGFSISGTKFRKYRTLIPFLRQQQCKQVIIIGGPFSNHVLGITQLLIENGIEPILFLKGVSSPRVKGNFAFLQMLVTGHSIHWIPKGQWHEVEILAARYAGNQQNVFVLPEGAPLFPAFLGALTLPLDIMRNENEENTVFEHIFFEVGTGLSAAALLLGLAFLEKPTHCHLLLVAETEEIFFHQLRALHVHFENWLGQKCPFPAHFTCHRSSIAPSFGSTNNTLFNFIKEIAHLEGLFLDPIYSGKLFYHAKKMLEKEPLSGNILLIHSGGAWTLSGFEEQLACNRL